MKKYALYMTGKQSEAIVGVTDSDFIKKQVRIHISLYLSEGGQD
jgi:hypothetical protein